MTDGKKPARYACHRNGVMVESESGEYVEYADLIAAQKERDDWKARAIGIDITLEGSNERFRKAEQALALRGEPVAPTGDTHVDFERWLRTECFQAPPEHSYQLAKAAWKKAIALYAAPISGEVVAKPDYDRLFAETRIYDNVVSGERAAKETICYAAGPRCHGCAHYRGEADICVYAPAVSGERVREALPCKCGLKTVPQGVDGVLWYWQRHARDECTLELPNEKCWCGLLRSEHKEGHADALPLAAIQGEQE